LRAERDRNDVRILEPITRLGGLVVEVASELTSVRKQHGYRVPVPRSRPAVARVQIVVATERQL
jgi:hypothetical protein